MTDTRFYSETRHLAYDQTTGRSPGIVFLSGFNSTKEGTKATFLEGWARDQGRAFLRFDYSGHGASAGRFEDGTIGQWFEDAANIIEGLTEGPQVLVGSSMGGWIACLLSRRMPERLAGLVLIAAAPDFTENRYWVEFDSETRIRLEREGAVQIRSPYDEEPYEITKALIEEGRKHLVLNGPLYLPCATRFLHGTEDEAIPVGTAQQLFEHARGEDIRLTLVKGADHRFSSPKCLDLIARTIDEISPLTI